MTNFWHSLKQPILALAPMEGVTDSAFRRICKERGADVVYTEFIAAEAIAHNAKKALEKMRFDPSEQPVVCQIFGSDVASFVSAAREIERRGFAGIDVNLGCPARKVVRKGAGVALMREPKFARTLIASITDTATIPISIKIRTSIRKERVTVDPSSDEHHTALDLIAALKGLPVTAIMVHGRSFENGFTGAPDTDMIKHVAAHFNGIVLANGGIKNAGDAKRMLDDTGAHGVGIARGALGNPWIFNEVRSMLNGEPIVHRIPDETLSTIYRHAELLVLSKGPWGLHEFRKHLLWYVKGFEGAAQVRAKLARTSTIEELHAILDPYFTRAA